MPALPALASHLVTLADGWAVWRWVGVRSAGFGVQPLLDLAHAECAAAADAVLAARLQADATRHELSYRLRQSLTRGAGEPAAVKRAIRLLRKADATAIAVDATAVPADVITAAHTAAHRLHAAEAAYRRCVVDAGHDRSRRLAAAAADPRFREAVAWQNRHALRTGVDTVAGTDPAAPLTSQHRQHQALVANYLQRYCAKNDTIGFFGPVGWARITEQPEPLSVAPGPDLLATRTVYLEDWCVSALAARLADDRRLRPWLTPRRMPYVDIVDRWLHIPLTDPVRLSPLTAAVLSACDGVRNAGEIADVAQTAIADVLAILDELSRAGRIAWTLEVPSNEVFPERALRRRVEQIGDTAVRAPALAALAELEGARDAVAAATGDAQRLVGALESLEATFTGLTGKPPTRRDGQAGAGRTLVYEDCRRDIDVTLGATALAGLGPPLALLLESARWYTYAGATLFRRACAEIYRARSGRHQASQIPFAEFWLWVNDLFEDGSTPLVTPVVRSLQERWARLLAVPPGQRRVRHSAAELRERVIAAFAVPRPGWAGAVRHSPDVMIAASSLADIRAARFEWVVGELHPGTDTLSSGVFVTQHPCPAELRLAVLADLPPRRLVLAGSRGEFGAPIRIRKVVTGPDDLYLVFARDTCGLDPQRCLPVGSCVLEDAGGHLTVRTRDGQHAFDLLDVLGELLMLHLLQHFRILAAAEHSPRITVDRVVLCRESWTFDPVGLPWASDADEARRFLAVRQWQLTHGMPRFVFAHTAAERKPFCVDLDSLASADLLARAVRRAARRASGPARVTLTEMLPEPGQLWLTDIEGNRYTSELRMVAVDLPHAHRGNPRGSGQCEHEE